MFKTTNEGVYILVKIIPKASKSEVVGWENDRLKIRLSAIPEKGLANAALITFLSDSLSISKSRIHLVQGDTARLKKILIQGLSPEEIKVRLFKSF